MRMKPLGYSFHLVFFLNDSSFFIPETSWKRITTWSQYHVWLNSPTLSRWQRWDWGTGQGAAVSAVVFSPCNLSWFTLKDRTERFAPREPHLSNLDKRAPSIACMSTTNSKNKREKSISVCSFFLFPAGVWGGERRPLFPRALPKGTQAFVLWSIFRLCII